MNKKKLLQIIFAIALLIGLVLTMFKETRVFGLLVACVLQPLIGLYYLSIFKKEETNLNVDQLIFRYPLLFSIQTTFIGLVIQRLFSVMQWPFAGPMKVFSVSLSCITLILGLLYVVVNRKRIQSIFVIEFVLIAMPVLLFVGIFVPKNYSSTEYAEALNKEYEYLNNIEHTLYRQAAADTTNDLSTVNTLEEIKNDFIKMSGGYNDDNKTLIGGLNKVHPEENAYVLRKLKNDRISILLKEPATVIDHVNTITKLQIDLLLKERQ